jgi:hypothetical protein
MNILKNNCCSTTNNVSFSCSDEDKDAMYHACVRSYIPYLSPSQIKNIFEKHTDVSANIVIEEKCESNFATEIILNKQSVMEFGDLINQNIFAELCSIGKIVFISSSLDGNVYVWKKDKKMFVTFRGTSSNMDILIDLYFTMSHWQDDIYVHSGIKNQFMSLEKNITMEITDDIEEIHFSGHSLGSGLGTFASAYYGEKYPNIKVTCMTFGGPKVGNAGFVKWFDKHVYKGIRMCHCGDPIPLLPFWRGWNHVKNTWYIKGIALSDKRSMVLIKNSSHELTNYIHALL